VAALTVLGHCRPQLKVHINGALNVSCEPATIIEVILQMVLYVGFPTATNAMLAAHEVFNERGLSSMKFCAEKVDREEINEHPNLR
jgi:4-carboxymuconolactone decarboxylase